MHKKEIRKIIGKIEKTNYTAVPISLYWQKQYVKVSFAIVEGKKLFDKRQDIKLRDIRREEARSYKGPMGHQ